MNKNVALFCIVTFSFANLTLGGDVFEGHTNLYQESGTFDSVNIPDKVTEEEGIPNNRDILEKTVNEKVQPETFYRRHGTFESVIQDTPKETEKDIKDHGLGAFFNDHVEFGGIIEAESYTERDYDCNRHSDTALEDLELDFLITLNKCASGFVSIEYENDFQGLFVKEGYMTLGDTENFPYFLTIGRLYVPFGIGTGALVGDTLSVVDPLTIEIFETREDVILVGARSNGFYGGVYVFNGESFRNNRHHHIDQYGGTIRYAHENSRYSINAGFDVISTVYESEDIPLEIPEVLGLGGYSKGLAAHVRFFSRGFSLIAEFNGTFRSRTFYVGEGDERRKVKLEPKAWQVELGYIRELYCRTTYVAANFSESRGMYGYFPRSRFLATLGRWVYDGVLIALEYGHDVDYPVNRGGTGSCADFFVLQLALEW